MSLRKYLVYGVCIAVTFVLIGVFMVVQKSNDMKLEKFDDVWKLGYPAAVEEKLYALLPQAKALTDKSIYLQILSQIALAQALQKKFDEAHKTLDDADALLTPEYDLARARIFLERARVFHQSEKITEARVFFEKSRELSLKYGFDYYAIDATHMLAIISETAEEKITWNQRALAMAEKTKDKRAHGWFGSLYNNLGHNYLEAKQFDKALLAYQKTLEYRLKEDYNPNIRVAKWAIARTLRFLGRLDDALRVLEALMKEYDAIAKNNSFDMPIQMFKLARGLVAEEFAEIYDAKAKVFSSQAYNDLSDDPMFRKNESDRLERLKELQK